MLTITIFAAGLVCLAGVLGLRLWRAQAQVSAASAGVDRARVTDERGITLQTLIVTAVLVLMAVAAGVVIVAITNNAAEDLEQQATSIESQCDAWEVYDPVLASKNSEGRAGGDSQHYEGSDFGCIPACIWEDLDAHDITDDGDNAGDGKVAKAELRFNRNYRTNLVGGDSVAANDKRVLIMEQNASGEDEIIGVGATSKKAKIDFDDITGEAEVRVGPDQSSCVVYDVRGDRLHTSR